MGSQLDFFAALEETNLLKTSIMSKSSIILIRCDLWRELLKAENSPASVSLPLPARGHHDHRHFYFHLLPCNSCSCYQGKGKRSLWKKRMGVKEGKPVKFHSFRSTVSLLPGIWHPSFCFSCSASFPSVGSCSSHPLLLPWNRGLWEERPCPSGTGHQKRIQHK